MATQPVTRRRLDRGIPLAPPPGCSAAERAEYDSYALKYVKRVNNPESAARRWHYLRMVRALWMYLGRHWAEMDYNARLAPGANGGYAMTDFVRDTDSSWTQKVVDNQIAIGVDNRVARLGRKEWEPHARPERSDPELEAAARLSVRRLLYDLEQQHWPDLREALAFDLTVFGTCVARSVWDERVNDVSVVAAQDAAICGACNVKFASRSMPKDAVRVFAARGLPIKDEVTQAPLPFQHLDSLEETDDPDRVALGHCPVCAAPTDLADYAPSREEAEALETDLFGRPLGITVPRGEGLIEVVSPLDLFPENGGVGVEPATCRVWGQATPRDIDLWLAPRYPEIADAVDPDDPQVLLRNHPTMGDRSSSGGQADDAVYRNHVVVEEVCVDAVQAPGLDLGRRIIVIKDRVVVNGTLCTEVERGERRPPKKVPHVRYRAGRAKRWPKMFWGPSPVDDATPLNRQLNELLEQKRDLRERGKPFITVDADTEIIPRSSGNLAIVDVYSSNPQWSLKDNIVNGQPLTGNAYTNEEDRLRESIRDILGPTAVEAGRNDTGVKSGQHLAILSEESAQKLGPAERALTHVFEGIFQHNHDINWAFRKEKADFEIETDAGTFEFDAYTGNDLTGEVRIHIETKGVFDRSLYQSQGAKEAVGLGLYDVQDPETRGELLDIMDLPNPDESRSIQVRRAEQTWSEFRRRALVPVLDLTVIDPWVYFRILGKRWQEDEAVERQRAAGWDRMLAALAGWQQRFELISVTDEEAFAIYGNHPPEAWQQIANEGAQRLRQVQDAERRASMLSGQPPPPAKPFPKPPAGGFLPRDPADRLTAVLVSLLPPGVLRTAPALAPAVPGMPPPVPLDPAVAAERQLLLRMYAVIQVCRMESDRRKQAAMAGASLTAAPGGAATAAGTEPVAGQPIVEGQGVASAVRA